MELTLDHALQQAVAAHKEGKLQEAERFYRAILQAQPNDPDANHNLGALAVAVGKPLEAIPLFKLALETNPQREQFWLSYIDVLIKVERLEEAKRVLAEGERSGVSLDNLDAIKQRLKAGTSGAEPAHSQLNNLLEHYQTGKLEEAEELAKILTQQFPKHPFGWKVLGAVYQQTGRLGESLAAKQKSAGLSPQDAEAHNNLGNTLQELGRLDEAEASLRQAIALRPDYAEAHNNLGNTLEELGRLDEAEASYRQAVALKFDYAEAHSNLGAALKALGKLDEAEASYRKAIALKPDYAEAHSNLGVTLKELGRLDEAEASFRKAIALKSDYAEAYSNLGNALRELGRLDDAETSLRQAIALKPDFAEAHYNLGNTLKVLGRLDEAEATYRKAIAQKPDFAEAHNNFGNTLQELGRLDEAEASLRQAIAIKPDYAEAQRNLATMKKFSSEDEQFCQMHALYRDPASSEKNRCHICFALAKATEDLEDYATAFQFYAEGNALRKKQLGYEKAQDKKLFERLKATYPRIAGHTFEPTIVANEPAPVFIVGMPRSGTTLVEQISSSHPLVTGAGELPLVSQFGGSLAVGQSPADSKALAIFREEYLSALKQRSEGNAIVTDKMPHNFRFLGLIATALPEAKIIHVKRDSAAVCWANYTQYFANDSLGYCYSLDDILYYHHLYQDLMQYWYQALPDRIYDLDYDGLTENQEEETRELIDHLGLEWDDACLSPQDNTRGVATASAAQVRQKVYQGSSEKWKRYQPFLNSALDHLGVGNQ